MKNTIAPNPHYQNQTKGNGFPFLSTAALTSAVVALGAAVLLASPSTAEDRRTTLAPADEDFIKNEATAGTALLQIATIAEKKAERGEVRVFAGKLVTDHTKAKAELAKLASAKGVDLSTEVSPKHAQTIGTLEALSGAEFDKEFLSSVQSGHEECVGKFQRASADAKDEDLKAWAATMLPSLRMHLAKAKELGAETTTGEFSGTDNTAPDAKTVAPFDQGNSGSDTDTTAQIRKAILAEDGMSVNAKNIKIITEDGLVTLSGAVKSSEERRQIGKIATRIAGDKKTDNQLEIEGTGDRK